LRRKKEIAGSGNKITIGELKEKKVGVVFSSGFFGFFAHAGFFKALQDLGIKPVGYSGTSSGAILAAYAATGMDAQAIAELLLTLKKDDFWDPEPWYKTGVAALTFLKGWLGYLKGEKFYKLLGRTLPVQSFEELKTPCVIVGCNLSKFQKEVFTSGSIAEAVYASGTIPWIFKIKYVGEDLFLDGGLVDKVPLEALSERVDADVILVHYIASLGLKEKENAFLSKVFSPQKAYSLSMDIVRQEHYQSQKKLVEQRGIRVIELKPSVPPVTPNRLDAGRAAFDTAYQYAMKVLEGGVDKN
jgi:NTE family protein